MLPIWALVVSTCTIVILTATGKNINLVACGSAHSVAWSTTKPESHGKRPAAVPMEYNLLFPFPIATLQNRSSIQYCLTAGGVGSRLAPSYQDLVLVLQARLVAPLLRTVLSSQLYVRPIG